MQRVGKDSSSQNEASLWYCRVESQRVEPATRYSIQVAESPPDIVGMSARHPLISQYPRGGPNSQYGSRLRRDFAMVEFSGPTALGVTRQTVRRGLEQADQKLRRLSWSVNDLLT